ncbi:MAG: FAD:protein FMN transferase [Treponemataceae bacterium]
MMLKKTKLKNIESDCENTGTENRTCTLTKYFLCFQNKVAKRFAFFAVCFFVFMLFSCNSKIEQKKTCMALGTVCSISLFEAGTTELYDILFERIDQIEQEMSTSIESSEISRLNKACLNSKVDKFCISDDVYSVLQQGLEISRLSDGVFDLTIGALVQLWGINEFVLQTGEKSFSSQKTVPTAEQIEKARSFVDWKSVQLEKQENSDGSVQYFVSILKPGIQLETGGIAKGFVADELVSILRKKNIKRAVIDLGGNIYAFGAKSGFDTPKSVIEHECDENGVCTLKIPEVNENAVEQSGKSEDSSSVTPWKIGIKNPDEKSENPIAILDIINKSVVTSGSYERYFELDGKKYHHIIDTRTGFPSQSDLLSSSIIHENSMLADSLSTLCFILGSERSVKFLHQNFPDTFYFFVLNDGKIICNYEY